MRKYKKRGRLSKKRKGKAKVTIESDEVVEKSTKPESWIVPRKRRRLRELQESLVVPAIATPIKWRQRKIIGPYDTFVNTGLGKVKIEQDFLPAKGIKDEPLDIEFQNEDESEDAFFNWILSQNSAQVADQLILELGEGTEYMSTPEMPEYALSSQAEVEDLYNCRLEPSHVTQKHTELDHNLMVFDIVQNPEAIEEQVDEIENKTESEISSEMLQHVLPFLDMKSLRTCRLVHSAWKKTATDGIRSRYHTPANLTTDPQLFEFLIQCPDTETLPINRFKMSLVTSFKNNQILENFLAIYGLHVKHLEINVLEDFFSRGWDEYIRPEDFVFSCMDRLKMILELKELETLKIQAEDSDRGMVSKFSRSDSTDNNFGENVLDVAKTSKLRSLWVDESLVGPRDFLGAVISLTPGLQTLHLTSSSAQWSSPIYKHPFIRSAFHSLNLSVLHLSENYFLPAASFWPMLEKQRLIELSMCLVVRKEADQRAYEHFFESQSDTLRRLTLTSAKCTDYDLPVKLPIMRSLKYLGFEMERYSLQLIQPRQIENVVHISLPLNLMKNRTLLLSTHAMFPKVKQVSRPSTMPSGSDITLMLRHLGAWFPNLRRLENFDIRIPTEDLKLVFRHLNRLEDLELFVCQTDDDKLNVNYALSGIPQESAWLVEALFRRNETDVLNSTPPPGPGLHNMERLRSLGLTFESEVPVQIDQIGVQMALLRIQPLRKLNLRGNLQLSTEHLEKLNQYHAQVEFDPEVYQS